MRHFRYLCLQGFEVMDREWMYKKSRLDPSYLDHLRQFVAAAKRHCLRLNPEHTICPCNSCKNNLAHKDNMVQSHLIWYGFIKDYTSSATKPPAAAPSDAPRCCDFDFDFFPQQFCPV